MLPSGTEYGRRLAAVLPTVLETLLTEQVRQAVVIVVDGLGWVNLRANKQFAPNLSSLAARRITTVAPSTTAAALTTITTGVLPSTHGLLGYRIFDPQLNQFRGVLKEWQQIADPRTWQMHSTVFERALVAGVKTRVFARAAHATSGFTNAVLTGAEYIGAQRITERFAALGVYLRQDNSEAAINYLYVDELDKAGHHHGANSEMWLKRLSELDECVGDLLAKLPKNCGIVLTADHGMIDIPAHAHRLLEAGNYLPADTQIGGEPRCRYFKLADPDAAVDVVAAIREREGSACWVDTAANWVQSGIFGEFDDSEMQARLADIVLIPRKRIAYLTATKPEEAGMIGQHGGLDDDELGVPLLTGGAYTQAVFDC